MTWILTLSEMRDNRAVSRRKVMTLERPDRVDSTDEIGLRLDEARQLLSTVQQLVAASQIRREGECRRICSTCGQRQSLEDCHPCAIDTRLGRVDARRPRYRCRLCESAWPGCSAALARAASTASRSCSR